MNGDVSPVRLEALFHRALELASEDRPAFLRSECGEDTVLLERVLDLLRLSEDESDAFGGAAPPEPFLVRDVFEPDETTSPNGQLWNSLVGSRIGRYEVESIVAFGGMGAVLAGRQTSPNRRVALKLLRPEMVGADMSKRFRLELEILGRLQHPGIGQVFEGGTEVVFGTNVPYFAMEFVPNAEPIHRPIRQRELDIASSLHVFLTVCAAVSHAHHHGVIHRDLKADNVLVDSSKEQLIPKVIDFGIARLSEQGNATFLTASGYIVGSLEAMSPEQTGGAEGAIDVRTDVYGLGVILYQILTGRVPLEIRSLGIPEAIKQILEARPARPSLHRTEIEEDLDAIVLKCLEKEPDQRYESVAALREDILAYLDHRPVSARVPTALYQLRTLARKHRAVSLSLAMVFVCAILAGIVSTKYAVEAGRSEREALRQAYRASLSTASRAIAERDNGTAEELLESTAPEFRGWEWEHLHSRLTSEIEVWDRFRAGVTNFRMTLDGRHYLTGGADSTVRVWDAETGTELLRLTAPGDPVGVRENGDGSVIAAVRSPGRFEFCLWNADGTLRSRWEGPPEFDVIMGLGLTSNWGTKESPRGVEHVRVAQKIVGDVIVYDLESRSVVFRRNVGGVQGECAFDPRAELLATTGRAADGRVVIYLLDASTSRVRKELRGPEDSVYQLVFSDDGRYLVGASADAHIYLWDVRGDFEDPLRVFRGHKGGGVSGVRISDDGEMLASWGEDRTLLVWDVATGGMERSFGGFASAIRGGGFRPGTKLFYTIEDRGPVRVWDLSQDPVRTIARHESYVYPIEVSEPAGMVVSGGWDGYAGRPGALRWSDLETGVGIGSLGDPGTIVLDADMAEDGTNLVVAVRTFTPAQDPTGLSAPVGGGAIEQVSMRTGAVTKSMEFDSRIESIAREPGGSRVAFGSVGSVGVIDLEEGRELLQRGDPRATDRDIGRVAWSPDGRWIGAAVMHDDIQIWDAANYEVVARGMGHDDLIWSVGFDPTSRYLATTSEDGTVRIWSVPDGRELHHLTGHGRSTLCARFQPDGSRLATGGRDARILIWRTDTFDRVASLEGHGNYVFDLEWTSDGSRLLSSSGDGTVRVWETTSLAERRDATIERAQIVADLESGDSTMVGADSGSAEPASDGAVASASASSGATSSLSSREQEVVWQFQLRKQLELHEARTIAN